MSELMQQQQDRQLRMYALERACTIVPVPQQGGPLRQAELVVEAAEKFEKFLRGETA